MFTRDSWLLSGETQCRSLFYFNRENLFIYFPFDRLWYCILYFFMVNYDINGLNLGANLYRLQMKCYNSQLHKTYCLSTRYLISFIWDLWNKIVLFICRTRNIFPISASYETAPLYSRFLKMKKMINGIIKQKSRYVHILYKRNNSILKESRLVSEARIEVIYNN